MHPIDRELRADSGDTFLGVSEAASACHPPDFLFLMVRLRADVVYSQ
jgi:hypothetical protein